MAAPETSSLRRLRRLRGIDEEWVAILRPLRLDRGFAPSNLGEQRDAFLEGWRRGRAVCPHFVYDSPNLVDTEPIFSFRRRLRSDACSVERRYDLLADEALSRIRFLNSRRPEQLSDATIAAFGAPDAAILSRARALLEQPPPPEPPPPTIVAEAAADRLREAVSAMGLGDWTVRIDSLMNARMSVDSLRREVKVRAGSMFRPDAVARLLVHEIGVHVRRAHRGSLQPLPLLGRGVPGYLATEEGLAVWHEHRAGLLDPTTLRIYAARVLAADAALTAGFVEVFEEIESFVGADAAFEIAARSKRGLKDPSPPGAHTKDHVYLRGFVEVSEHLASRPHDLPMLMSAKIGLSDIEWFGELADSGLARLPST